MDGWIRESFPAVFLSLRSLTQLRLVLTITKSDSSGYSGKVDSLDQGVTIPVDTITVTGDTVGISRPEFKSLQLPVLSALFPFALEDEGRPIIGRLPLFLFPDRQLSLA